MAKMVRLKEGWAEWEDGYYEEAERERGTVGCVQMPKASALRETLNQLVRRFTSSLLAA